MKDKPKYDVLVSYSRENSDSAESIARFLSDAGLRVWFDKWSLIPGEAWEISVSQAIENADALVFCVGATGVGKWQEQEVDTFLQEKDPSSRCLIPVLLPGSNKELIPSFLRDMLWVDLRDDLSDEDALNKLVSAIRGTKDEANSIAIQLRTGDKSRVAGDLRRAAEHYERALAIAKATYGQSHPLIASLMHRLGIVKQDQGDYAGALSSFENALKVGIESYGEDAQEISTTLNSLGSVLRDQGQYDEALMYFERLLAIDEASLGKDHPDVARDLNNLAQLYQDTNRLKETEPLMQRALKIYEPGFPR